MGVIAELSCGWALELGFVASEKRQWHQLRVVLALSCGMRYNNGP